MAQGSAKSSRLCLEPNFRGEESWVAHTTPVPPEMGQRTLHSRSDRPRRVRLARLPPEQRVCRAVSEKALVLRVPGQLSTGPHGKITEQADHVRIVTDLDVSDRQLSRTNRIERAPKVTRARRHLRRTGQNPAPGRRRTTAPKNGHDAKLGFSGSRGAEYEWLWQVGTPGGIYPGSPTGVRINGTSLDPTAPFS